jgi:A/G-specific adenine glycosylase
MVARGFAPVHGKDNSCSHLNQSLMELGALVCAPRNPQCLVCPVKKLCVAFKENRTDTLPNLGKRAAATARRFVAFVLEHRGKFLVRQRPENVVNAHLWEFPNVETNGHGKSPAEVFESQFGFSAPELQPLPAVKHSITRYRITLEAFRVPVKRLPKAPGTWLPHTEFDSVAFTAAHKKLANFEVNRILAGR